MNNEPAVNQTTVEQAPARSVATSPADGILRPGLLALPIGMERYTVVGGGSLALSVEAGDQITVEDRQGLQPAELVLFDPEGVSRAAFLGRDSVGQPYGIQRTLAADQRESTSVDALHSGRRVWRALEAAGFDLGRAEAIRLHAEGSRAGARDTVLAEVDGLLLIAAPGTPMPADTQLTSTELIVYRQRVRIPLPEERRAAPDPLADPLRDDNILPGQALAYEVKAGEYIQILDVQGRECSDFQAISQRALDRAELHDIDPTTTRSLNGSLYPSPGLYSKYFSIEQEPLVELVQDTCGRHDTFGLACTARYYEDLGYPGHVNCTDNINRELDRYGVKPRAGWPAINFFFNTLVDDVNSFGGGSIGMDEPWSRPGDFVLLRALSDLVCVSSACPCDVDPANGWNPTDIQLRVYRHDEDFKRSIGWRKTPEAPVEDTRETGFHESFSLHTRDFVEYKGYWLPNQMTAHGAIAEYWACREKVAIMDLSPLRKYEVLGPDAERLLQSTVTRDMKKLAVGQVVYTAMCYEHGGMIDDGTVFRLGDNNFRWIGGNDTSGLWLREQAERQGLAAWVRDSTPQLCNVAVQGRFSREVLAKVFWTPPAQPTVEELGWFRFTLARLGDFHGPACVISRTGYSGELGYEVFCHPRDAKTVFDAISDAGEPHGLMPLGLAALDLLRIESGLIFADQEFSDQTDPFEAGIGFTVPLKSKTDDFIGRDALETRKAHPQRRLVGLDLDGSEVPGSGDCVRVGKAQVGEITSAMRSPILGKVIALARLDVTHAAPGTRLEVGQLDGLQKRLAASVVSFPHFDPGKERVKGNY